MEVGAEAEAGATREPDDLPLADVLTDTDLDHGLVAVTGRERSGVLDAGVVAVAADPAGDHDPPGVGCANRSAGRHADVDAGVARLPRTPLAERRGDRPVHGPDHRAGAAANWARRRALLRGSQLGRNLRLHLRKVALEAVSRRAHTREDHLAAVTRTLQVGARRDELALDRRDLVAALLDRDRRRLLLLLQRAQFLRLLGRLRLQRAHARDDLVVLVGDAVQELRALEQVGEAVRFEHDGER